MKLASAALAAGLLAGCSTTAPVPTPSPAATRLVASPTALLPTPAPAASPTSGCVEGPGEWIEAEYPGVAVGGMVPVRVYLPSCASEPGARYPVAYFLHGKPYTEQQWLDLGIEDQIAADGDQVPMILVLARQPEPLFSGSDGGPGSYETEFLSGLVPWVDETFPTDPDPSKRAVVGLSRGGVWALELAMTHPEVLGTVVALSPALAVNHARPPYDPLLLAGAAPALPGNILLATGDTDWARTATEELARRLIERDAPFELQAVPGAHADPTWAAMLPAVLEFLSSRLG